MSTITDYLDYTEQEKEFAISSKGRVYRRGAYTNDQDIAKIKHLIKTKTEQEVAEIMEMDIRTVKRYVKSTVVRVGGNRQNHDLLHSSLKELIQLKNVSYLREQISTSTTSISNHLYMMGYSRKKVSKIVAYRSTQRVQDLRADFRLRIKAYSPFSFFYLDESHFDSFTMEVI